MVFPLQNKIMDLLWTIVLIGCFCYVVVRGQEDTRIHIAKVGDRYVLPCYYDGVPTSAIRWFKNREGISYGTNVFRNKDKFEIETPVRTETNLVIKNVDPSDEATYSCRTIENGQDIVIGERQLKVENKPSIDDHASSPNNLEVRAGQTVTIWCNVSGTPEPEVTWQRYYGRNVDPEEIGARGNELTIHNITKYASDTYICRVANRHGEVSRQISVTVLFPVKATVYQEVITSNYGVEVFMACMVEGNPIIQAYWKNVHGMKVLNNWQFEVSEEDRVGGFPLRLLQLKIRSNGFSVREYGNYSCYVAGESPDEHTAVVQLKPIEPQDSTVVSNYQ